MTDEPLLTYRDKKYRTNAGVLVKNYDEVTGGVKTTPSSYHHTYSLDDKVVYSIGAVFNIAPDKSECSIQIVETALGSWSEQSIITITKEQFKHIVKAWDID